MRGVYSHKWMQIYFVWIAVLICIVNVRSHRIIELVVPAIADPREKAHLVCKFDMENDYLYSAKWYKDSHEIVRYLPSQEPSMTKYPVEGIVLGNSQCTQTSCMLTLFIKDINAAGQYRCEVSTEAPTFRIVQKNASMAVAAFPKRDPIIQGIPPYVKPGQTVNLNCTTALTLPHSNMAWYVNGKEAPADFLKNERTLQYINGLTATVHEIDFRVEPSHLETSDGSLTIRCEGFMPQWLPYSKLNRSTTVRIPQQSTNLVLSWFISGTARIQLDSCARLLNFIIIIRAFYEIILYKIYLNLG